MRDNELAAQGRRFQVHELAKLCIWTLFCSLSDAMQPTNNPKDSNTKYRVAAVAVVCPCALNSYRKYLEKAKLSS